MKKIHIGIWTFLLGIATACHAHAGMYDRYVEMMDVLYAIIKTIFAVQLVAYLVIVVKWGESSKRIRMKLLYFAKRLCKNQWVNLFVAWALSSFVLTSYWYVFCSAFWIMGIIPLFLFGILYLIVFLKKKMRVKLLSGIKAIYIYLIASVGQSLVFALLIGAEIFMLYAPINEYTEFLIDVYSYTYRIFSFKPPFNENGIYVLAKGMWQLSLCLALPYILLIVILVLRTMLGKISVLSKTKDIARK